MISLRASISPGDSTISVRELAQTLNVQSPISLNRLIPISAIEKKYNEVGGRLSRLSLPLSEVVEEPNKLFTKNYLGGSINFLNGETTAQVQRQMIISYKGFHCFGETDNDQLSGADEIYIIVSAVPLGQPETHATVKFPTDAPDYHPVNRGNTFKEDIQFYSAPPGPVTIRCQMWESDFGNAEGMRNIVDTAVTSGLAAVGGFLGFAGGPTGIIGGGAAGAALGKAISKAVSDAIADDVLNLQDDNLGSDLIDLTWEQMEDIRTNYPASLREENGIIYNRSTVIIGSEFGASYKAYFDIHIYALVDNL